MSSVLFILHQFKVAVKCSIKVWISVIRLFIQTHLFLLNSAVPIGISRYLHKILKEDLDQCYSGAEGCHDIGGQ